jgi:antitoxin component YwqK of YwqJK toxin-antitoxin module
MIKMYEEFSKKPEIKEEFYANGQKEYEIWYLNGKYHREDGPTYQEWFENGQKKSELWYLNGKKYSREEWVDKLKTIESPHYDEQRMLLDVEKYNL